MASIKQLDDRRFKITVSNGYRPDGKKICRAKTIRVPESIPKRGIRQYVAHEAEELERQARRLKELFGAPAPAGCCCGCEGEPKNEAEV